MKKLYLCTLFIALSFLSFQTVAADVEPGLGGESPRWTIEDVFGTAELPFAIGHRGYGEDGTAPLDKPIENTTEAVRRALREGAQMVEVDAVLTGDGIAVALHDDFLGNPFGDYTCINKVDYKDLKGLLEDVSTLRHILQKARTFSNIEESDRPGGQVVVEIKTPSPLCDPADETIPALVDAVINDIEHAKMKEQVIVESYSPEILRELMASEPAIPRMLAISILQLMTPEQIWDELHLEVTLIDKGNNPEMLGLQWAEIGPIYRLPGYASLNQYISTLLVGTASRTASLDMLLLGSMEMGSPGSAAFLVASIKSFGPNVVLYTVKEAWEWYYFAGFGVDGIIIDNVPLGLILEGTRTPPPFP